MKRKSGGIIILTSLRFNKALHKVNNNDEELGLNTAINHTESITVTKTIFILAT